MSVLQQSQATKCFHNHTKTIGGALDHHCHCQMRGWYAYMHMTQGQGSHTTPDNQCQHVSHVYICMDECLVTSHKLTIAFITTPCPQRLEVVFRITIARWEGGMPICSKAHKPPLVTSFHMFPMTIFIWMSVCQQVTTANCFNNITAPQPLEVLRITTARWGGGMPIWSKAHKPHLITSFHLFPMTIYVLMSVWQQVTSWQMLS